MNLKETRKAKANAEDAWRRYAAVVRALQGELNFRAAHSSKTQRCRAYHPGAATAVLLYPKTAPYVQRNRAEWPERGLEQRRHQAAASWLAK